jgi:hypothetical protein
MLALLACLSLVVAWAHEDGFFGSVFAVETAFAVIAAVYSSW